MKTTVDTPKKILIISNANDADAMAVNATFADRLHRTSADRLAVRIVHYNDIGFTFEPGKPEVFLLEGRLSLAEFDVVFLKSRPASLEQALAIADCLHAAGVPLVGDELLGAISRSKLSQYARLSAANLPLPKAIFLPPTQLASHFALLVQEVGVPFILKDVGGFGGNRNFLIRDEMHFRQVLDDCPDILFMAQQFIANTGDLRVLVVGGKVRLVILRERRDDSTHLNNTSQGAHSRLLSLDELGEEAAELSVRAAHLFKRAITGVDVLFESGTNRPYILEINAHPQIASGSFVDEKAALIADYLLELAV